MSLHEIAAATYMTESVEATPPSGRGDSYPPVPFSGGRSDPTPSQTEDTNRSVCFISLFLSLTDFPRLKAQTGEACREYDFLVLLKPTINSS